MRTITKYSNTIEYQIRTTLDSSGIAKLKAELNSLQQSLIGDRAKGIIPQSAFDKTLADIKRVDEALTKAFNGKLGMLDLKKFNSELTASGRSLNDYYKSFSLLGSQGTRAFGQMYGQLTKIDTGMKQVSSTTDKIANTFGNTFRWGIIASMFSGIMNSFHQATQYVKDLDTSLTNIMMVSGESRDAMNEYARAANEAAKALGNTTVGMTNATQVFVQQGYDLGASQQLAKSSVVLGNISQQDTATASDEITAYMNAFKININDLNNALSKWAIVANVSAADVQELSVASQKAASAAVTTGVNMDQLAAQIATIETVTREAPENIGNGLKTLYARFSDIQMGKTLEDGVDLGKVTSTLQAVGVQVLNAEGNMREVGDIMEDLMDVWGNLDLTQKNAIGQTLAGKFQYTRFSALMNRSDLYKQYLEASESETGTSTMDMMQATFEDSMQGRLNKLQATAEGIFTNAFNTNDFYDMIDALTQLVQLFDDLIQSIGGGKNALMGFGAVATKVFSKNIAQGIGNTFLNRETNQLAKQNMTTAVANARQTAAAGGAGLDSRYLNDMTLNIANVQKNMGSFSQEQLDVFNEKAQKHIQIMTDAAVAEKEFSSTLEAAETLIKTSGLNLSGTTNIEERYFEVLQRVAEAQADGVPFIAEEDEMYQALMTDIQKLNAGLVRLADGFESAAKSGEINAQQMKVLQENAKMLNIATQELGENESISEERKRQLARTSEVLSKIQKGEVNSREQLAEALKTAGIEAKDFYDSLYRLKEEAVDVSTKIQKMGTDVQTTGSYARVSSQEIQGMADAAAAQNFALGVANLASGAMNVLFAVQSIQSAFSAIVNEDLDPFEKLEQSLMGFSMAAMMAGPMIRDIANWYKEAATGATFYQASQEMLTAAQNGYAISLTTLSGAIDAALLSEEGLTKEKAKEIAETYKVSEAHVVEMAAKKGAIETNERYTLSEIVAMKASENLGIVAQSNVGKFLLNISSKMHNAAATELLTGAEIEATIASKGLGATLLAFAGPVLIAVGAVTALVLALKLSYDAYYADARAMEKAQDVSIALNKEYQNAKNQLTDLTEKLKNLKSLEDNFKGLTKGTQEWKNALSDTNAAVLDLMSSFPELSKYVSRTENGLLELSDQGKETAQKIAEDRLATARQNNYAGQVEYNNAKLNSNITDFGRDIKYASVTTANVNGETNTQDLTLSNQEVRNLIDIMQTQNKTVNDLSVKDITDATGAVGDTAESILSSVQNNGQKLETIANQQGTTENANRLLFDEMMRQKLGDGYSASTAAADQAYEQWLSQKDAERSNLDYWHMDSNDLAKEYANMMGYNSSSIHLDRHGLGGSDDEITMKDASGKESTFTRAELEEAVANQKALSGVIESYGSLSGNLSVAINNIDSIFGKESGVSKVFRGEGEIDATAFRQVDWSKIDLSNPEFLSQLNDLGFESWDQFQKAFENASVAHPIKPSLKLDSKYDFDTDAEVNDYLDKYTNIDRQTLDTATSLRLEDHEKSGNSQFAEDDEKIAKAESNLEETKEKYGENSKEAATAQEAVNQARKDGTEDTELYEKAVQRAAAAEARATKAVESINDTLDENAEILQSADKSSIEYAEALQETKEQLGGLLDVDPEMLSNEWASSAETLELMKQAAEGDEEAFAELRAQATQDIIANLKINQTDAMGNPVDADYVRNTLSDMVADLNSQDLSIDMEANLDDSNWYDTINEMLASGKITADQLTQVLSSAGYEGEIDYKEAEGDYPATTYTVEVQGEQKIPVTAGNDDSSSIVAPSVIKMVPQTEMVHGKTVIPVLKGATQKGGITNAAAPANRGKSGGKSGGSGGGGGGKGGSSTPKTSTYKKDKQEREKDRYEKVNTALEKIDSSLNNIKMDQDRLTGIRALDNLKKETNLLKEQIPWYEKKLEIQKEEAEELRNQLSSDFGAAFDASGQLQNYSEIYDQLTNEYEEARQKWDGRTLSDEEKEAADKELSDIEKRQKIFDKIYARYDTLYSKDMPDTEKSLKEIQDKLEDIAEESFKARHEAAEMLNDMRETARDTEQTFQNLFGEHPEINLNLSMKSIDEIIGGPELEANLAKYITDYENKLSQATDKNMKQYYQSQISALKRVQANGGNGLLAFNENRLAEVMRMWNEWQKTGSYIIEGQASTNEQALLDLMKEAVEDGNDLMSNLSSAISDAMDNMEALGKIMDSEIENQLNGMDAINDKIEHQQNMIELIYGDQASAAQIQLLNRQAEIEENRVGILEKQLDIQKQATATAKEMYEADLAAHGGRVNQDLLEKYLDALDQERDIDSQILETREKIAESYKDAKEAANDLAVDDWLTNFQGQLSDNGPFVPLEYMADQWERIQENEELYLDDLNKAYEIQKLSNKYQQMLNDTTDPKIQQQITDQMREQLGYLNEKTNLSKYDVDYANAQLEILQKTIALEDARAAKNQMKLRRDSQGNYQYVYAADQNQTAEAENDLLDASMNAYNMSKEQQADVQDSYIKKVQDMADALRKAANDATLNEEQIAAITQDIIDKGHEYLKAMGEQLNTSQKNMISSFIDAAFQLQEEYASGVRNIAEELQEDTSRGLDDVDDRFDTSVNNWVDGESAIREQSNKTRENIINNINNFTDAVTEANLAVVDPLGEIQSGIDGIDDSIVKMKDDMSDLYNTLDQQTGAFANAGADVEALQEKLTDANNALSKYSRDLQAANDKIQELQTVNTGLTAQLNGGSDSGDGSGSGGSGSSPDAGEIEPGDQYRYIGGLYYYDSYGSTPVGDRGPGGIVTVAYTNFGAPYPIAVESDDSAYGWLRPDQLVKLKSGGYTGEWGEDGRMAMLHEKELVLNSTDTQNILAAVDAVRMITEQLKGSAFINNIGSSIGRAAQNNLQGNNVEQRVEITANFPNVNSAEEIERALLNISDRSYQYAYNKNDIPW